MHRRDLFLEILEQVRAKYDFVVAGYVVMPEHVHLLIGEPRVKETVAGDASAEATCVATVSREEQEARESDAVVG